MKQPIPNTFSISSKNNQEDNMATTYTNPARTPLAEATPFSLASLGWLLGAALLLLFSDGRFTIPLAMWLSRACLLWFVRSQPRLRGLALAYAVLVVTRGVSYYGMIPIPGIFYYIFLLISGISAVLPYLADRLLAGRLRGLAGTLVFPVTLVATQYVYVHGPTGSWGAVAYTQTGNMALTELASVTGLWGVTFLVGWFAAIVCYANQQGIFTRPALRALGLFAAVSTGILMMGEARQAFLPPSASTVRIASLSPAHNAHDLDSLLPEVTSATPSPAATAQFNATSLATQNELFDRTEREAQAGAKIVFWSETAAYVLKPQEPALLARGSALAAKYKIYFAMALGTWTPGAERPLENKLVMIEPTGNIAWQYLKARPTPGPEMAAAVKPDGKLRSIDTPYGRLVAAICYDMDFAELLAQASALKADIVLSPASDWRAIDPRHTEIAAFRAVEQGFNLVRQANLGFSAAYDYQGHRLAQMDHFRTTGDLTMVSQVPIRGTRTLYSLLGDWLAWLSLAAFPPLIYRAIRRPALTSPVP